MDEFGITPEQYASGLHHMYTTSSLYYVALTLFVYDSLCLMSREVDHIHRGKWTLVRTIYLSIRVWTLSYLMYVSPVLLLTVKLMKTRFALYTWTHNYLPAPVSLDNVSYTMLILNYMGSYAQHIFGTEDSVVKILLVLRLRALWGGNLMVTTILLLATAAEMIINSFSTFAVGIINQKYMLSGFPLWSCFTVDPTPRETHILHVAQSGLSLELGLTLIKLGGELNRVRLLGNTIAERVAHVKTYTPIIYVFYRDGTLFFIPFSVMAVFALLSVLTLAPNGFNPFAIDWTPWVAIVYYLCGTRLILNVREAGCKLTQSMFTRPEFETLRFQRTHRGDETNQTYDEESGGIVEEDQ
ncbi:hypothetical protein P691DRAFT_757603 [Macrolepiota fuliginosa MF-IS2]|uniref:DUF6533 domain-containing protein n=1 Tax=Macrolepiota fuliginosa MF-IS2 TaxID=1400762 RepID=A0A9P5XL21_9AGAR|nr:hypothetical protein P691DRAFT_757603 [Macrolepiota fuliginosa MF-IS2]